MGLYIKDMNIPKTESEVLIIAIKSDGSVYPVRIDGDGQLMVFPNEEMKNCAVPVPEPHGRLIDADALHSALRKRGKEFSDSEYGEGVKCGLADAREFIKNAPTIIPASEEG